MLGPSASFFFFFFTSFSPTRSVGLPTEPCLLLSKSQKDNSSYYNLGLIIVALAIFIITLHSPRNAATLLRRSQTEQETGAVRRLDKF